MDPRAQTTDEQRLTPSARPSSQRLAPGPALPSVRHRSGTDSAQRHALGPPCLSLACPPQHSQTPGSSRARPPPLCLAPGPTSPPHTAHPPPAPPRDRPSPLRLAPGPVPLPLPPPHGSGHGRPVLSARPLLPSTPLSCAHHGTVRPRLPHSSPFLLPPVKPDRSTSSRRFSAPNPPPHNTPTGQGWQHPSITHRHDSSATSNKEACH